MPTLYNDKKSSSIYTSLFKCAELTNLTFLATSGSFGVKKLISLLSASVQCGVQSMIGTPAPFLSGMTMETSKWRHQDLSM